MTLVADANKISQVIDNLISNAVKYSPKGGRISIDAMVVNQQCRIEITDEGIGMTADQLERVFDKFYRVDSSNTAVGGLGIGMSIVKAIIEGHSGSIDIRSSLGQGTTIIVNIPLGPDHPPFQASSQPD